MNVLLPLLIVTIALDAPAPDAPIENRYPEAVTVFHCTFDASWDKNFDTWPDRWTRRKGRGFPHYVRIKLDDQPSPPGGGSLRIEMDGGAAVAYSPPIRVNPLFGYVLEGYLETEDLNHDRAYFSITLLDEERNRLETFYSQKIRQTSGWKKFRLGPVSPGNDAARTAVIGLHVQSQSRADLNGRASFGDVWLGRVPRLALGTSAPYNLFRQAEPVQVHCVASGFVDLGDSPQVIFELEDVLGRRLARLEQPLDVLPADLSAETSPSGSPRQPHVLIGKATWQPPLPAPGFYRARATMKGAHGLVLRQQLTLALFDRQQIPAGGEFGWTLPHGERPVPLPLLTTLICQSGINWVKYPLWHDKQRGDKLIQQLITFGERLGEEGIELVGLLHDAPKPQPADDRPATPLSAAELFAPDPESWYPSLEPVMSRLATRVRWWQLGDDHDTSFIDHPNLLGKISQVKDELDRLGRDVNLGIPWGWLHEPPPVAEGNAPWRFLTLSSDPPLTHRELAAYLQADRPANLRRWVVVEPLSKDRYPVEVRAEDLLRRMIAAKIHGADAVFCPQPFSTRQGLLNDDGTPGELLFTWRTVARTLGAATFIGSMELPEGSPNQLFSRGDDVVMVVWNDQPTDEIVYLGEDVRQIDLWGRTVTPSRQGHRQVIRVGRLPSFLTGIHKPITRWRQGFVIAQNRIPSIFNRPHPNSFSLKNHFARDSVGRAELVAPTAWKVSPPRTSFWLADSEEFQQDFTITLPHNANSGRHPVRADFEIEAERTYRFSVYRWIEVGLGDVYIEVVTRLNERDELEVDQRLVNQSDGPISFRCELLAPDRRRQKTQVIDLRPGRDHKLYRLPDGKQLLGKTLLLRADQIGGPQSLTHRFQAEP